MGLVADSTEEAGLVLNEDLPVPSRRIRPNSRSQTGLFWSRKNGRIHVPYESLLEHDFCVNLEFDRSVERFESQPLSISYRRPSGRWCDGHLDYLVVHYSDTGLKPVLVDVKTQSELLQRWDHLHPRFRAACEHARSIGMLYHIRTERRVRTPFFYNVRRLLRYLREEPDPRYESIFLSELSRAGRATFYSVLDRCCSSPKERLEAVTTLWTLIAHQAVFVDFRSASLDADFEIVSKESASEKIA